MTLSKSIQGATTLLSISKPILPQGMEFYIYVNNFESFTIPSSCPHKIWPKEEMTSWKMRQGTLDHFDRLCKLNFGETSQRCEIFFLVSTFVNMCNSTSGLRALCKIRLGL